MFLVDILANECGCVRTLASPVGRGLVFVCVCVCVGREGVCGRIQGKIITANWPEAMFPLLVSQSQDTHKTPAEESC